MSLTALVWFLASTGTVAVNPAIDARGPGMAHAVPVAGAAGFVENVGQWAEGVRFHGRFGVASATVFADRLLIAGPVGGADAGRHLAIALVFPQRASAVVGEAPSQTLHHYHYGSGSFTGARAFDRVALRDVAAGIDVTVREDAGRVAYDLTVQPGARLEALEIEVAGATTIRLDDAGELVLTTPLGQLTHRLGACWQTDPTTGERTPIHALCRIVDAEAARFGFEVAGYDLTRELVVDPTLMFCTYVGSTTGENLDDAVIAPDGSTYLLTRTHGLLPLTPGVFQSPRGGGSDAWVGKLSASGTHLEWSGCLGGNDTEHPKWLALAPDGGVVVVGRTWSPDFPTTTNAYQGSVVAKSDMFVTRISQDGAVLLASTLFGGDGQDGPEAVAVSTDGAITAVVDTTSTGVHATAGAFDEVKDAGDKLMVRFQDDMSAVVWATWFHVARINRIEVDSQGGIFIAGQSSAVAGQLPTTPGAFMPALPPEAHPEAGYVGKMRPEGSGMEWGTYIASTEWTTAWGVSVGFDGGVYVVGMTVSGDFPTTPNAFSSAKAGADDGFALKLLPDGSGLVWSTMIGGCCGGGGYLARCRVDPAGNLWTVGFSNEPNWPTTPDALLPNYIGGFPSADVVLTKFDVLGETLVYSTHLGGSGSDNSADLGLASDGTLRIAFHSYSSDLPVTPGAYQPTLAGLNDLAVVGLDVPLLPWRVAGGQSESAPHVPNLVATGTLEPGAPTRLVLRGGAPRGIVWVVLGLAELNLPLPELGCDLYPWPNFLIPLPLGPDGSFDITFPAPDGPGDLFFQVVGYHPEAPGGLYFSNGLRTKRS